MNISRKFSSSANEVGQSVTAFLKEEASWITDETSKKIAKQVLRDCKRTKNNGFTFWIWNEVEKSANFELMTLLEITDYNDR
jgi:hypothetical protein